jgi:hypothetical protein
MIVERFTMGFPGRSRSVGGQLDAEQRGTLRRKRAQTGGVEGEHLIAKGTPHRCRGHRQRGGQPLTIIVNICAEMAHRVGLVSEAFSNR